MWYKYNTLMANKVGNRDSAFIDYTPNTVIPSFVILFSAGVTSLDLIIIYHGSTTVFNTKRIVNATKVSMTLLTSENRIVFQNLNTDGSVVMYVFYPSKYDSDITTGQIVH